MGPNIAETLMRGFNCTLVLDGFPQTGKTYTMIGEGTEFGIEVKESDGLLPRLVRLVFDHILDTAEDTTEFTIGVSTYAMVRRIPFIDKLDWRHRRSCRSFSRKIRHRRRTQLCDPRR
jgi:hypothetical protein